MWPIYQNPCYFPPRLRLYPDKKKMGKQFDYANKRNIPFVVVAGETEIANDLLALKSMKTGEQEDVSLQTLITKMS